MLRLAPLTDKDLKYKVLSCITYFRALEKLPCIKWSLKVIKMCIKSSATLCAKKSAKLQIGATVFTPTKNQQRCKNINFPFFFSLPIFFTAETKCTFSQNGKFINNFIHQSNGPSFNNAVNTGWIFSSWFAPLEKLSAHKR